MKIFRILAVFTAVMMLFSFGCTKKSKKTVTKQTTTTTTTAPQNTIPSFSYEFNGFAYKSYNINDIKAKIAPMENEIAQKLKSLTGMKIVKVTGHADRTGPENPTGNKMGNIPLSEKRASAVVKYFVDKYQIPEVLFDVEGKGSMYLKSSDKPFDKVNRRVELEYSK